MRSSVILGLLTALLSSSLAAAFEDPKALVTAIYEPYQSGRQHADLQQFYSENLRQLFAEHSSGGAATLDNASVEIPVSPSIDFNPFIDARHALLLDVVVGDPVVVGDQALVTVGFHNFDQPTLLSLSLVRENDGWKVDDVTSMGGEENWMLSWVLKYDPWAL